MTTRLTLYRREDCPLCDHAEEALRGAGVADYETTEVGWSGELAERYGERVPVLVRAADAAELAWPFDVWTVRRFVSST
jgi:hypothetical protein